MFKIGEFSTLTQVSVRMLRYYDETGLLKPAAIDPMTNYRLYSTEQISKLNKIIFLRDLGFNVSEIFEGLQHWKNGEIIHLLDEKALKIEEKIKEEKHKLSKISLAKKDIYRNKIQVHYNVSIKKIPSYQVLTLRRVVSDYYAEGQLWKEMSAFASKNRLTISDQTFSIYHDPDYREKNVDIEICAPVTQMGKDTNGFIYRQTEPIELMASTMVYGSFENIAAVYLSFANWLEDHPQYRMGFPSRQIVHRGPWNEEKVEDYLTEIQIPLEEV